LHFPDFELANLHIFVLLMSLLAIQKRKHRPALGSSHIFRAVKL